MSKIYFAKSLKPFADPSSVKLETLNETHVELPVYFEEDSCDIIYDFTHTGEFLTDEDIVKFLEENDMTHPFMRVGDVIEINTCFNTYYAICDNVGWRDLE